MDEFGDGSFVNLDDISDHNDDCGEDFDMNGQENHNDLGGPSVGVGLGETDHRDKRIEDMSGDDIRCMEFASEEDGCLFYQTYAKCHGFVVKKDEVCHDFKGNVIMRQFVCNKEGTGNKKHLMKVDRKKEHRPITRVRCEAKLRIRLNYKTCKWKVVSFVETHNHELPPYSYVHLYLAYRGLTDADKAQVDRLHAYGVRTCHIMGYMLDQKGGYASLGFCRKDLYNYIERRKLEKIKDGDAHAALCYIQSKANNDPTLRCSFLATNDGCLRNLFWADGGSRADYYCFGDVLAFNTTYTKNRYNKHLVIFSGCNHHGQTDVFGCGLVADETIETYKWLLEEFLRSMSYKHPVAVVTNGDSSMREAIKQVFPNALHRLCAWHLHKNACENVKNLGFLDDFKVAMYSNFTEEKFEVYWKRMVAKHGLVGNKWVTKTYENRSMWASAYFRDKLFGRIRTTSQCEAINSLVKAYVNKKDTILEFINRFEQVLREYMNNELIGDFKSTFTQPVLTTSLQKIESEAAKIFTLENFREVKSEIEVACSLNVIAREGI